MAVRPTPCKHENEGGNNNNGGKGDASKCLSCQTVTMSDVAADGTRTTFLRTTCRNCKGEVVSTQDTDPNGKKYKATGKIDVFSPDVKLDASDIKVKIDTDDLTVKLDPDARVKIDDAAIIAKLDDVKVKIDPDGKVKIDDAALIEALGKIKVEIPDDLTVKLDPEARVKIDDTDPIKVNTDDLEAILNDLTVKIDPESATVKIDPESLAAALKAAFADLDPIKVTLDPDTTVKVEGPVEVTGTVTAELAKDIEVKFPDDPIDVNIKTSDIKLESEPETICETLVVNDGEKSFLREICRKDGEEVSRKDTTLDGKEYKAAGEVKPGPLPGEDECCEDIDCETLVVHDDETSFLRTICRNRAGEEVSRTDRTLEGEEYEATGEVKPGPLPERCEIEEESLGEADLLDCDTHVLHDGSCTDFFRTVCRDCTGAVVSRTDTELDGKTPYTPVAGDGTVGDDEAACVRPGPAGPDCCDQEVSPGEDDEALDCETLVMHDGSGTSFLRTVCRDCTGAVASSRDTRIDGKTRYRTRDVDGRTGNDKKTQVRPGPAPVNGDIKVQLDTDDLTVKLDPEHNTVKLDTDELTVKLDPETTVKAEIDGPIDINGPIEVTGSVDAKLDGPIKVEGPVEVEGTIKAEIDGPIKVELEEGQITVPDPEFTICETVVLHDEKQSFARVICRDHTGKEVSRRDETLEGEAYRTQGEITGGTECCPTITTLTLCDDNGPFFRHVTRTPEGETATADTDLAGEAYEAVGDVGICESGGGKECPTFETETLCDKHGKSTVLIPPEEWKNNKNTRGPDDEGFFRIGEGAPYEGGNSNNWVEATFQVPPGAVCSFRYIRGVIGTGSADRTGFAKVYLEVINSSGKQLRNGFAAMRTGAEDTQVRNSFSFTAPDDGKVTLKAWNTVRKGDEADGEVFTGMLFKPLALESGDETITRFKRVTTTHCDGSKTTKDTTEDGKEYKTRGEVGECEDCPTFEWKSCTDTSKTKKVTFSRRTTKPCVGAAFTDDLFGDKKYGATGSVECEDVASEEEARGREKKHPCPAEAWESCEDVISEHRTITFSKQIIAYCDDSTPEVNRFYGGKPYEVKGGERKCTPVENEEEARKREDDTCRNGRKTYRETCKLAITNHPVDIESLPTTKAAWHDGVLSNRVRYRVKGGTWAGVKVKPWYGHAGYGFSKHWDNLTPSQTWEFTKPVRVRIGINNLERFDMAISGSRVEGVRIPEGFRLEKKGVSHHYDADKRVLSCRSDNEQDWSDVKWNATESTFVADSIQAFTIEDISGTIAGRSPGVAVSRVEVIDPKVFDVTHYRTVNCETGETISEYAIDDVGNSLDVKLGALSECTGREVIECPDNKHYSCEEKHSNGKWVIYSKHVHIPCEGEVTTSTTLNGKAYEGSLDATTVCEEVKNEEEARKREDEGCRGGNRATVGDCTFVVRAHWVPVDLMTLPRTEGTPHRGKVGDVAGTTFAVQGGRQASAKGGATDSAPGYAFSAINDAEPGPDQRWQFSKPVKVRLGINNLDCWDPGFLKQRESESVKIPEGFELENAGGNKWDAGARVLTSGCSSWTSDITSAVESTFIAESVDKILISDTSEITGERIAESGVAVSRVEVFEPERVINVTRTAVTECGTGKLVSVTIRDENGNIVDPKSGELGECGNVRPQECPRDDWYSCTEETPKHTTTYSKHVHTPCEGEPVTTETFGKEPYTPDTKDPVCKKVSGEQEAFELEERVERECPVEDSQPMCDHHQVRGPIAMGADKWKQVEGVAVADLMLPAGAKAAFYFDASDAYEIEVVGGGEILASSKRGKLAERQPFVLAFTVPDDGKIRIRYTDKATGDRDATFWPDKVDFSAWMSTRFERVTITPCEGEPYTEDRQGSEPYDVKGEAVDCSTSLPANTCPDEAWESCTDTHSKGSVTFTRQTITPCEGEPTVIATFNGKTYKPKGDVRCTDVNNEEEARKRETEDVKDCPTTEEFDCYEMVPEDLPLAPKADRWGDSRKSQRTDRVGVLTCRHTGALPDTYGGLDGLRIDERSERMTLRWSEPVKVKQFCIAGFEKGESVILPEGVEPDHSDSTLRTMGFSWDAGRRTLTAVERPIDGTSKTRVYFTGTQPVETMEFGYGNRKIYVVVGNIVLEGPPRKVEYTKTVTTPCEGEPVIKRTRGMFGVKYDPVGGDDEQVCERKGGEPEPDCPKRDPESCSVTREDGTHVVYSRVQVTPCPGEGDPYTETTLNGKTIDPIEGALCATTKTEEESRRKETEDCVDGRRTTVADCEYTHPDRVTAVDIGTLPETRDTAYEGSLDGGLTFTVKGGRQSVSKVPGYTFSKVNDAEPDSPQTWTFSKPVKVRLGINNVQNLQTGLIVTLPKPESVKIPEGFELEVLAEGHKWDPDKRTLTADTEAVGSTSAAESTFIGASTRGFKVEDVTADVEPLDETGAPRGLKASAVGVSRVEVLAPGDTVPVTRTVVTDCATGDLVSVALTGADGKTIDPAKGNLGTCTGTRLK